MDTARSGARFSGAAPAAGAAGRVEAWRHLPGRRARSNPSEAAAPILESIRGVEGARAPRLDAATLAALLEVAFYATLTDDEGRPTLPTLALRTEAGTPDEWLEARIVPRPLTTEALRRLAPAAATAGAAITVRADAAGAVLDGLAVPVADGFAPPPWPGLAIVGRGRGVLDVNLGRERVASLVRGTLRLYRDHLHERDLVQVIVREAPRVAGPAPHSGLLAILRAADAMTASDHGGTLLVVPEGPYEAVPGLRPAPRYVLAPDGAGVLGGALATFRERNGALARAGRREEFAASGFDAWVEERTRDREARNALAQAVRLVAGLSAVDGAVVASAALDILAFGAMIDTPPEPDAPDVPTIDPVAPGVAAPRPARSSRRRPAPVGDRVLPRPAGRRARVRGVPGRHADALHPLAGAGHRAAPARPLRDALTRPGCRRRAGAVASPHARPRSLLHAGDRARRALPPARALPRRGRRQRPRAHRAGQPRAQLLRVHVPRGGARRGARRRGRVRARRRPGPARRRAARDQGPDADRGAAHDARLARVRAQRARAERADRRAARAGRRDHGRQDDDAGVRLLLLHGLAALGHHAQPVGPSRARPAARPAAPARRSRRAACRSPRARTWAARSASRPRGAASSA